MEPLWSALMAEGSRPGSGIDADALILSARTLSGAFADLDPALERRFRALVEWANTLSIPPGRARQAEMQLRELLANRLRIAADRARLPQIAESRIERPVFVVGFPRTGTTLLHSLLADDPDARAPLRWHTTAPSPPPGEVPVAATRIERAGCDVDRMLDAIPGLLTLHPYWDRRGLCPVEDEEIVTLDFHDAYPSLLYHVPGMPDARNSGAGYGFHREFLQHLQWNQPSRRWVLKGVFHQFALDALFETYPDALCIWPHRNLSEVCPSLMALLATIYGGLTDWRIDFRAMGPAFVDGIRQGLETSLANPRIDDPRIVHVRFDELTRSPVSVIQWAYEAWGLPVSPAFEGHMRAWLGDPTNDPGRHGRYPYAPEPFGLSYDHMERAFGAYHERFGLVRASKDR
jgi:hypothetical protein